MSKMMQQTYNEQNELPRAIMGASALFPVTDSATFTTTEASDEETGEDLGDLLLEVIPDDGTTTDVSRKKRLMT